jgi:nucleotide-binding universal stress UspA family protein
MTMARFKRILCPVDLSDTSTLALRHAAAFARWYDSELVVQHVLPSAATTFAWSPDLANQAPISVSPDRAVAGMRDAIRAAGVDDRQPRLRVDEGFAHDAIVSAARDEACDLLVIGTHGRSGFSHLFLGSVTEKVIRTAACPVLTVPPSAASAPGIAVTFKRILCPIDFSPSSKKAFEYAQDLARQSGGVVTALSVCEYTDPAEPDRWVDAGVRASREQMIADARERLHALVAATPRAGGEVEEVVALHRNRAAHEILARAVTERAELIVMGAQGAGGIELMLYGSNTHHVVRAAASPVLTVRA